MKTYEKNDVSSAKKQFAIKYIVSMFIILYITDIINHASDISINGLTVLRSILCFAAILILSRVLTKIEINKFQITKSNSDNLRFNINLIIIAVAVISLFYFLFSVNSNVKSVKNTASYKIMSLYSSQSEADEIVERVAKDARKSFLIVWVAIMVSSAIVVGTEGNYIEKLCLPDDTNSFTNNDTNTEIIE